MSSTPTNNSSSQQSQPKFQKGLFSQLSQSAIISQQVIGTAQTKQQKSLARNFSPRLPASASTIKSKYLQGTSSAQGREGKVQNSNQLLRDRSATASQSLQTNLSTSQVHKLRQQRDDSQISDNGGVQRSLASQKTTKPLNWQSKAKIDTGIRANASKTPRPTSTSTNPHNFQPNLMNTYDDDETSGMPLTTQTSRKTIRQDETMLSHEPGLNDHLMRQKLSIDERVAAQQEAKKSVQNQQKLFTEDNMSQGSPSLDISGASFPQFILQTLIDKRDGTETGVAQNSTNPQKKKVDDQLKHKKTQQQPQQHQQNSNNTSQTTLLQFNESFSQKSQTMRQGLHSSEKKEMPHQPDDLTPRQRQQQQQQAATKPGNAVIEQANQRLYYNRVSNQNRSVSPNNQALQNQRTPTGYKGHPINMKQLKSDATLYKTDQTQFSKIKCCKSDAPGLSCPFSELSKRPHFIRALPGAANRTRQSYDLPLQKESQNSQTSRPGQRPIKHNWHHRESSANLPNQQPPQPPQQNRSQNEPERGHKNSILSDSEPNPTGDKDSTEVAQPVHTSLSNASNFAIVQNLKRIEENYNLYASSHVELAETKLEVKSLREQLAELQKEKDLVQKSQTSLCGFLQDLRDRMTRGASVNEMQRMIARKLVVHAKYSKSGRLKSGLTDDDESSVEISQPVSRSLSRGRSQNRSRQSCWQDPQAEQAQTMPVETKNGDKVINLQKLAQHHGRSLHEEQQHSQIMPNTPVGANYSTQDHNKQQIAGQEEHPLRDLERQHQQRQAAQMDFPVSELSSKQSMAQFQANKKLVPKIADLPFSGEPNQGQDNNFSRMPQHMQSHGQLMTISGLGKADQNNLIRMEMEAGPELLRRHQHMMSVQNLNSNANAANLLMPGVPANNASDVYEYTLSKAYSSDDSITKEQQLNQRAHQEQANQQINRMHHHQQQHSLLTESLSEIPHVQQSVPTQSTFDGRMPTGLIPGGAVGQARDNQLRHAFNQCQTLDDRNRRHQASSQMHFDGKDPSQGDFEQRQIVSTFDRRNDMPSGSIDDSNPADNYDDYRDEQRPQQNTRTGEACLLMRDSEQEEDMQSPPTELGQTNGRSSRIDYHERSLQLRQEMNDYGAQVVTNQSQNMFNHERRIEIAVALQSFDPAIDLQIDDHNPDEFLSFRAGEKILIENRQIQEQEQAASGVVEVEWAFGSIGGQRKGWFPVSPFTRIEQHSLS